MQVDKNTILKDENKMENLVILDYNFGRKINKEKKNKNKKEYDNSKSTITNKINKKPIYRNEKNKKIDEIIKKALFKIDNKQKETHSKQNNFVEEEAIEGTEGQPQTNVSFENELNNTVTAEELLKMKFTQRKMELIKSFNKKKDYKDNLSDDSITEISKQPNESEYEKKQIKKHTSTPTAAFPASTKHGFWIMPVM